MKIKTSELSGLALDWAVTKCETPPEGYKRWFQDRLDAGENSGHPYSTEWDWGGPVIEREKITLRVDARIGNWVAFIDFGGSNCNIKARQKGHTALTAIMRCYVASKLGDEVEIPEELLK